MNNKLFDQMKAALGMSERLNLALDNNPRRALTAYAGRPEEAPLSLTDALMKAGRQKQANPFMMHVQNAFQKRQGLAAPSKFQKRQPGLDLGALLSELYGGRFS